MLNRRGFLRALGGAVAGLATGLAIKFGEPDMFSEQLDLSSIEMELKRMIQKCWMNGGNPQPFMMGCKREVISGFTSNRPATGKPVTAVDVYLGNFGDINLDGL